MRPHSSHPHLSPHGCLLQLWKLWTGKGRNKLQSVLVIARIPPPSIHQFVYNFFFVWFQISDLVSRERPGGYKTRWELFTLICTLMIPAYFIWGSAYPRRMGGNQWSLCRAVSGYQINLLPRRLFTLFSLCKYIQISTATYKYLDWQDIRKVPASVEPF